MKRRYVFLLPMLMVLVLVFTGCTQNGAPGAPVADPAPAAQAEPVSPPPSISSLADIEATLEQIYIRIQPSVVNIDVRQKQDVSAHPGIPGFTLPGPQAQQPSNEVSGSGFIWDSLGDIVTNNHVIANADNISVTFSDGTILPAKLVGADSDSDLAVIKVDAPPGRLNPVQMADSSKVKVGQIVIAIGNPFGLQSTMTVGFVSALGRLLPTNENGTGPNYHIPDVIQTDASINPGNSGGVLLDDTGKLIGVTQSIATTSGTSAGVGFAIPSAIVQQVAPALIKSGHYDHPYLGVTIVSLNPDLAAAMNLQSNQRGALVEGIGAGGPAEKAGLQASKAQANINGRQAAVGGDVIIKYNDQVVKSSDDLVTFLARSGAVGQVVSLTVLRDGKPVQVQITLGVRPSS